MKNRVPEEANNGFLFGIDPMEALSRSDRERIRLKAIQERRNPDVEEHMSEHYAIRREMRRKGILE